MEKRHSHSIPWCCLGRGQKSHVHRIRLCTVFHQLEARANEQHCATSRHKRTRIRKGRNFQPGSILSAEQSQHSELDSLSLSRQSTEKRDKEAIQGPVHKIRFHFGEAASVARLNDGAAPPGSREFYPTRTTTGNSRRFEKRVTSHAGSLLQLPWQRLSLKGFGNNQY